MSDDKPDIKNKFILFCILLIFLFPVNCSNKYSKKAEDNNVATIKPATEMIDAAQVYRLWLTQAPMGYPDSLLCNAYINNNSDSLDKFFEIWRDEVQPYNELTLKTFDKKSLFVYQMFSKMFSVLHLYEKASYIVIVPEIVVECVDDGLFEDENVGKGPMLCRDENRHVLWRKTIIDFRPNVSIGNKKVLYLNDKYSKRVSTFIKIDKRSHFLANKIVIYFEDGWVKRHFCYSFPSACLVWFNNEMTKIRMFYKIGSHNGGTLTCRIYRDSLIDEQKEEWSVPLD